MKRCWIVVFASALLLCACGAVPLSERETPAVEATVPAPPSAAQEELGTLLGELRQNVSIATAGSSLRAVSMAARLLDWAEDTEISDAEILAALSPWLEPLQDEIPADFREQLASVDYMFRLLTEQPGSEAEGLLSDAGCDDCGYPWSEKAVAIVERIMALAGLREAGSIITIP